MSTLELKRERAVKGEAPPRTLLTVPGGTVDGVGMRVVGAAPISPVKLDSILGDNFARTLGRPG